MSELDDMDDMSCDEFAGVAAELALGVLTGRERAAALAHLDGCESCREQVRELTMVQDELLALLPSMVVLVGSMLLLGQHWLLPALQAFIAV